MQLLRGALPMGSAHVLKQIRGLMAKARAKAKARVKAVEEAVVVVDPVRTGNSFKWKAVRMAV